MKNAVWLRSVTFAVLLASCSITPPSRAQWLELTGRPDPPALDDVTFAAHLAEQLRREAIERATEAETHRDIAHTTSINIRRLAHRLLLTELDDVELDSMVIMQGMILHDQRESTDQILARIARAAARTGTQESTLARSAINLLSEFNTLADAFLAPGQSRNFTEHTIAGLLLSLYEAIALFEQQPARSAKPDFTVLARRATTHDPDWHTLAEIAEFLERGWAFTDLRPRILDWHALLEQSLDYFPALADATWLQVEQRAIADLQARDTFATFRLPDQREYGEQLLRTMVVQTRLLKSITLLAQQQTHRIAIDPVRDAFLTITVSEVGTDATHAINRMNWLTTIVERMNRFRALEPIDHTRRRRGEEDLRRLHLTLRQTYLATEKMLLEQIGSMARDPQSAVTDPAMAALLAEHRRLIDDITRMSRMESWIDAVTLIQPDSAASFAEQLRRLALTFADPVRRIDAAAVLDRIEADIARYWPMPFERDLRTNTQTARQLSNNLHHELLELIDEQRVQWAQELADGNFTSDASIRLHLLHRLLSAMEDVAQLARSRASRDDRIAASPAHNPVHIWRMPPKFASDALQRVRPMLNRASRAAVEDRQPRLIEELHAIERDGALARLIGRLSSNDHALTEIQPHHHPQLAIISRYVAEAHYAQTTDRPTYAAELRLYANRIARLMLDEM